MSLPPAKRMFLRAPPNKPAESPIALFAFADRVEVLCVSGFASFALYAWSGLAASFEVGHLAPSCSGAQRSQ